MNSRINTFFASMLLITGLAVVSAFGQNYGGGRLAGTWDSNVSLVNCETGDPISMFQSTANFHQGGTFTGITSGNPPAGRSPEVGVWRHVKGESYRFRFKAYLFNPAGVAVAYQIITHDLELAADNLTYFSSGTALIYAMNGAQIGSGCSTGVGSRMTL